MAVSFMSKEFCTTFSTIHRSQCILAMLEEGITTGVSFILGNHAYFSHTESSNDENTDMQLGKKEEQETPASRSQSCQHLHALGTPPQQDQPAGITSNSGLCIYFLLC